MTPPNDSGAFRRALAAHRAGDLAQAAALYGRALGDEPLKAAHNLGVLLSHTGDLDGAERYLRRALTLDPDLPHPAYTLATVLLAQGRYADAWPLYEARRRIPAMRIPAGPAGLPEWRGEPLAGRRLLVLGEQGFGDQIMFGRFVEQVAGTYVCSPALAPLFAGAVPGAAGVVLPEADAWVLVASLPGLLGATLDTLPPPARLDIAVKPGARVGVVVRGRPTHENDAHRSLSADAADALLALGRDLSPEATGARDFRETAEIVAGLERVISVDTAIAHLAASMGKPAWVLIPAHHPDWRWQADPARSPWYPSVRLFRQRTPGDWAGVLDAVRAALEQARQVGA